MPWFLEIPIFIALVCIAVPIGCTIGAAFAGWLISMID